LRAALAAMLILSAVASIAYLLNLNPFAISFNIAFVYLPTAVLIIGPFLAKARKKRMVQLVDRRVMRQLDAHHVSICTIMIIVRRNPSSIKSHVLVEPYGVLVGGSDLKEALLSPM